MDIKRGIHCNCIGLLRMLGRPPSWVTREGLPCRQPDSVDSLWLVTWRVRLSDQAVITEAWGWDPTASSNEVLLENLLWVFLHGQPYLVRMPLLLFVPKVIGLVGGQFSPAMREFRQKPIILGEVVSCFCGWPRLKILVRLTQTIRADKISLCF